jgi:hypothetical protein
MCMEAFKDLKTTIYCVIMLCSPLKVKYLGLPPAFTLGSCLAYSSLRTEAIVPPKHQWRRTSALKCNERDMWDEPEQNG